MLAASCPRSVMRKGEEDLHRTRAALVAAGEEGVPVALEREAVGQYGGHVDAPLPDEVEIYLHRVPALTLEVLDAEGVRPDDGDLLEVQWRPLETARHLDAGDHEGTAGSGHADAHLDRLGESHRIVDDVDTAAVKPGHPEPGREHLRVRLRRNPCDDVSGRLVRQHGGGAEAFGQRVLVREAGYGQHATRGMEEAEDGDGEQPERAAAVRQYRRARR